ncbi:unnamed protein product, partial [Amoebophrya sp. A25]
LCGYGVRESSEAAINTNVLTALTAFLHGLEMQALVQKQASCCEYGFVYRALSGAGACSAKEQRQAEALTDFTIRGGVLFH